jgi:hypothetical protein
MAAVTLEKGREKSLLNRHPWVFSGAADRVTGVSGDGPARLFGRAPLEVPRPECGEAGPARFEFAGNLTLLFTGPPRSPACAPFQVATGFDPNDPPSFRRAPGVPALGRVAWLILVAVLVDPSFLRSRGCTLRA